MTIFWTLRLRGQRDAAVASIAVIRSHYGALPPRYTRTKPTKTQDFIQTIGLANC